MERLDSLVDTGVKSCFSFCLGPRSGTDLPTREERPEAFRGTASLGNLGALPSIHEQTYQALVSAQVP